MKKIIELYNRFTTEENAALDQWISVLVLAILAIVIFVSVKEPIIKILNGIVNKTGKDVNSLYTSP